MLSKDDIYIRQSLAENYQVLGLYACYQFYRFL